MTLFLSPNIMGIKGKCLFKIGKLSGLENHIPYSSQEKNWQAPWDELDMVNYIPLLLKSKYKTTNKNNKNKNSSPHTFWYICSTSVAESLYTALHDALARMHWGQRSDEFWCDMFKLEIDPNWTSQGLCNHSTIWSAHETMTCFCMMEVEKLIRPWKASICH